MTHTGGTAIWDGSSMGNANSSSPQPSMINFDNILNRDELVFGPGFSHEAYQGGIASLPLHQMIDWFYNSIDTWLLSYAEKIVAMPDSGFAALAVINAYPQMIAQLNAVQGGQEEIFRQGMLLIFPTLSNHPDRVVICRHLYAHFRSAFAHFGLTSTNVILCAISQPLEWGSYLGQPAVGINPELWVKHIREHFEGYVTQLRDPANVDLRQNFRGRLQSPF